ncbi:MAG: DMT family transporter [Syntrophaceae bacterium]|nr:DMT family transporter [Syntrophaceae bacterium]
MLRPDPAWKSDTLLLLTAIIWGTAFVAQRVGMDYVGPFAFNGIRFALGSLVLLPLIMSKKISNGRDRSGKRPASSSVIIFGGLLIGSFLFAGASLQQVGIVYTTAGNAGFITGLYVVIVPIMGLLFRQRTNSGTWIGAFLAAFGLYLLSVTAQFTMGFGDFLVLLSAFFWAGHVLIIGWLSPKFNSFKLAFFQYAACSLLSLITAAFFEPVTIEGIYQAAIPILYGGVLSVGIAYTLQVVAQRKAYPAHAAILLSMESVFAALAGWFLLDEMMTLRQMIGCALMLSGMLFSQLWGLAMNMASKEGNSQFQERQIHPLKGNRGSGKKGH